MDEFKVLIEESGAPKLGAPLGAALSAQALRAPDAPAVTAADGRIITRAEIETDANRRGRHLQELGVRADDIVFIAEPNGPAYYADAFAIWKIGATPAHVSHKLSAREFSEIVELGRPRLVIGGPADWTANAEALPADWTPDAALSDAALPPAAARAWKLSSSGGSTGRPKLILDPNPAVWGEGKFGLARKPGATIINPGPMFHSAPFALMIPSLCEGAHVVEMGRFDAERYLELVAHHRASWAFLVPTMMSRIARLPAETIARYDVSTIETLIHMAAPCPVDVKRFWIELLGPDAIWEIYGGTERLGSTVINGREWLEKPGSVGKARPGIEIKIFDEDGAEAALGDVGEIYFRRAEGPSSTFRYFGSEARLRDDWASFGDMGRLDADGYLFIADRRTDMFTRGGVNLYPAEIEAAIETIDGVAAAVVVGLPDDDLGSVPHAVIQIDDAAGVALSEAGVLAALEGRLAREKHPHTVEFTTQPVRNEAGKVRRSQWRADCIRRREAALRDASA